MDKPICVGKNMHSFFHLVPLGVGNNIHVHEIYGPVTILTVVKQIKMVTK